MPRAIAISPNMNIVGVKSEPPVGMKKIRNMWWDEVTGELVFDREE